MKKIFLTIAILTLAACSVGGSINLNGGSSGFGLGIGSSLNFELNKTR